MRLTGRVSSQVLDPAAAGVVALVVYALHGFGSSLGRDQATFVYGGVRFAHGTPPYRGIFNSVGPLGDMVSGLGTRLGWLVGLDDLTGARLVYLVLSAGCVAGVSVLARATLRSRWAGLLAPAVFLTFASFLKLATGGPREKTVMVLTLEIALLLLLRRRWFAAGVLTALATLTWQPAVLATGASALVAILTQPGGRWRAGAAYVLGGLVPTALLAAYFLAEHTLRLAWWGFVSVNVGYTSQPSIMDSWSLVTADYGWSLVLVGIGLVGLVAAAVVRRDRELAVLGTGAVVAAVWSSYAINGGADLFVALPFAAVGAAAGVLAVGRTAASRTTARVAAVVAMVAVAAASVEAVTTRDHRLPAERHDVRAMLAAVPASSPVVSVSAPEVLVLAHRRNPSPWQLFDGPISAFLDDHLDGGLAAYADRVARLHPALIAVGNRSTDGWLRPVLDRDYTRVGRGTHWVWYAATSLGHATLRDLRRANRDVRQAQLGP
jgi:hypothetical protein